MITLKQNVIDQIKETKRLRIAVQAALNISHTTLYKYLAENSPILTNANALKAIKDNSEFKTDKELLSL